MLIITALTLIKEFFSTYNVNGKICREVQTLSNTTDLNNYQFGMKKSPNDIRDVRRTELFIRIANVIKTPCEDSVFTLEALFIELKKLYLYTDLCATKDKLYELVKDYEEKAIMEITGDFEAFLSSNLQFQSTKEKLMTLFKELYPLLRISLRGNSNIELMIWYFKDKKEFFDSEDNFLIKIWRCYKDIFLDPNNMKVVKDYNNNVCKKYPQSSAKIKNYRSLLGMAGRTYKQLVEVYHLEGIFEKQEYLSDEIVYNIAGTILEYTEFYFCHGLSTPILAKDIMDSMIDYLHNGLMKKEEGQSTDNYINALFNRYIGNRDIKSYYYFLKMGVKIYHSIMKDCHTDSMGCELRDDMRNKMIKNIKKYDFPFLHGLDAATVYKNIQDSFKHKDYELLEQD
ncbi:MAG: hypothetical protein NC115_00180 [Bacteroidales bacterium]|nr:hypothetical protein [Roseburia sp.]MCM1501080.1 hypothetical protein [Bacteroidales bacterium]